MLATSCSLLPDERRWEEAETRRPQHRARGRVGRQMAACVGARSGYGGVKDVRWKHENVGCGCEGHRLEAVFTVCKTFNTFTGVQGF